MQIPTQARGKRHDTTKYYIRANTGLRKEQHKQKLDYLNEDGTILKAIGPTQENPRENESKKNL